LPLNTADVQAKAGTKLLHMVPDLLDCTDRDRLALEGACIMQRLFWWSWLCREKDGWQACIGQNKTCPSDIRSCIVFFVKLATASRNVWSQVANHKDSMISDEALSKMLVVHTEQCEAVASFNKRTCILVALWLLKHECLW